MCVLIIIAQKINLTIENVFAFLYGFSHDIAGIVNTAQEHLLFMFLCFFVFPPFVILGERR